MEAGVVGCGMIRALRRTDGARGPRVGRPRLAGEDAGGGIQAGPGVPARAGRAGGSFPCRRGGGRCGGVAEKEAGRRGERVGRGAETTRAERRQAGGRATGWAGRARCAGERVGAG